MDHLSFGVFISTGTEIDGVSMSSAIGACPSPVMLVLSSWIPDTATAVWGGDSDAMIAVRCESDPVLVRGVVWYGYSLYA